MKNKEGVGAGESSWQESLVTHLKAVLPRALPKRLVKNGVLTLGGNGVALSLNLLALSLAAHALPTEELGVIFVAQATATLLARLLSVPSWHAVIRLGGIALHKADRVAFASVVGTSFCVDLASAVLAFGCAWSMPFVLGNALGWGSAQVDANRAFSWACFAVLTATPTGVLRLLDRFGALAVSRTLPSAIRLTGSVLALSYAVSAHGLLKWWVAAELIGAAATLILAAIELGRRGHHFSQFAFSSSIQVLRFSLVTGLHTTLKAIPRDLDVLLVGTVGGPTQAAVYRLARQVGSSLNQLVDPFMQALTPELTRLAAKRDWMEFRSLVTTSTTLGSALGAACVVVTALMGTWILAVVGGDAYAGGYQVLLLTVVSSAIAMACFTLQPVTIAIGRPGLGLRALIPAVVAYVVVLAGTIRYMPLESPALAHSAFYVVWAAFLWRSVASYLRTTVCESRILATAVAVPD